VLGSSDFKTISDLDRPGVRVGGETNTTTIRSVARALKLATIVTIPSVGEAIDMLRNGKGDAFALGRDALAHIRQRFQVRVSSMAIFTRPESRSQCQRTDRTRLPRRAASSKKRRYQA
jgi:ABC-type amino acid transport substrate-binding protein